MRMPNPSPVLDKNRTPWVQKFYPVLGLGSGGRLLMHFQTPILYWINFSLRFTSQIEKEKKKGQNENQTPQQTNPGECLTPLGANPLVAEKAFPTSDYWGRTGVARCAEEMRQESVGISNRLLTPCHTRLRRPPREAFSYQGVSTGGLGARQTLNMPIQMTWGRASTACKGGFSENPQILCAWKVHWCDVFSP